MGRPQKKNFISNTALATATNTIAASASVSTKLTQGFPTGNALLHAIKLRWSGNLNLSTSSAGTVVTDGGLINIRQMFLSTPQHGIIINGLDGLTMANIEYFRNGVQPKKSDVSAATTGTPTFDYGLSLTFRDRYAARPEDTSLDMFQVSYMELIVNNAGTTDYISGGTYSTETIQVLNLEMHAVLDPGPILATDVPIFKPYLDILKIPVNQTQAQFQIILAYGGRIIKRYYIQQRNGSSLAPLANTVVGANDQDRLSFAVGGYNWYNRVEWLALQDENQAEFGLSAAVPTGMAALNWAPKDANGYVASDMLGLNSPQGGSPQTEIDVDVTSVTNGQLWVATEGLTPIPVDAQRPVTQPAAAK
jgi:hypothetical protein